MGRAEGNLAQPIPNRLSQRDTTAGISHLDRTHGTCPAFMANPSLSYQLFQKNDPPPRPAICNSPTPPSIYLTLGEFGRAVGAKVADALNSAAGVAEEHQRLVENRRREGLGARHDIPVIPHAIPADEAKYRETDSKREKEKEPIERGCRLRRCRRQPCCCCYTQLSFETLWPPFRATGSLAIFWTPS